MARGKHSPYTDTQGRYMTKSLFVEQIQAEQKLRGIVPLYTLNGDPKFIDVHEMYMELGDPTGYRFAIKAFASWEHFKYMKTLKWFNVHLEQWQEELEVRMRADAIAELHKVATTDGNRGITAAKYIADKGWETKRGRPSKAELEAQKKQNTRIHEELDADAKRLSLV